MPTRYALDLEALKGSVTVETLKEPFVPPPLPFLCLAHLSSPSLTAVAAPFNAPSRPRRARCSIFRAKPELTSRVHLSLTVRSARTPRRPSRPRSRSATRPARTAGSSSRSASKEVCVARGAKRGKMDETPLSTFSGRNPLSLASDGRWLRVWTWTLAGGRQGRFLLAFRKAKGEGKERFFADGRMSGALDSRAVQQGEEAHAKPVGRGLPDDLSSRSRAACRPSISRGGWGQRCALERLPSLNEMRKRPQPPLPHSPLIRWLCSRRTDADRTESDPPSEHA